MRSKVYCAAITVLSSIFAGNSLLAQSNWVSFTDVTDTNISTPNPQTTINDVEEKDIAIGDLNGNRDGTISVSQINLSQSDKTSGFGGNVHAADIDNDGDMDFGVADVDVDIPGHTRRLAVIRNNNNGASFTDPNNGSNFPWNVQGTYDLGWIDVNQDGKLDLLIGGCFGLELWFQN